MNKNKKKFDIAAMKAETNVTVTPSTPLDTLAMYNKLDELAVGQSYRMPIEVQRHFVNARLSHKRLTKKVFISRKIDNFNIRCWRVADGTVLATRKKRKS